MANQSSEQNGAIRWKTLVEAAKKAAIAQGYALERLPGRGLSNIWQLTKGGKTKVTSIRTTRDRWIAFPPLAGGTKWKTLDDVDTVLVATMDARENPQNVQVYMFPADDVRKRFNAAYAARIKDGQKVQDDFGMWVQLDPDDRALASSVGAGIIEHYKPIATYPLSKLLADEVDGDVSEVEAQEAAAEPSVPNLTTISDVISWARERVAQIAGVQLSAVKLDLKIEW